MSYLSKCTELHDDPDWILSDDSHQLHYVRMIKLTHGHCGKHEREESNNSPKRNLFKKLFRGYCDFTAIRSASYVLLGEIFPWHCLMLSFCTSSLPQTELGSPAGNPSKQAKSASFQHQHAPYSLSAPQTSQSNSKQFAVFTKGPLK